MATANVAEKPLCCRIDPPDNAHFVEDIARDADALQGLLHIAVDCQATGHHGSVADQREVASRRRRIDPIVSYRPRRGQDTLVRMTRKQREILRKQIDAQVRERLESARSARASQARTYEAGRVALPVNPRVSKGG